MAKTKAQRMKEYRARKKAEMGDEWLKRENKRVKHYFKPIKALSKQEKSKRRERNKRDATLYRLKQSMTDGEVVNVDNIDNEIPSTSKEDDNGVSSTTLKIKLPFMNVQKSHKTAGKKRKSRALAKAYREVKQMKNQNSELRKTLNKTRKRIARLSRKTKPSTPKSKVDNLMRNAGISPRKLPDIRKKLLYAECISKEVKEAKDKNRSKKSVLLKVVSGKIMKKYRLKSMLHRCTTLSRKGKPVLNKDMTFTKRYRNKYLNYNIKTEVRDFVQRDDNSRLLPGKADAVKCGETDKIQKRVLNDYLHNLHLKFNAESTYKVSLATFCRYRPHYISLVNFTSRSVCLCSKHQNFGMKLRCLKHMNVISCTSPDKFIELYTTESLAETLTEITTDTVKFQEWRRVKMPDGKERLRIVDQELTKEEFATTMGTTFTEFAEHVRKVKEQYSAIRQMKETLPKNHALVQMDFSENYCCQSMEEIQSAYWNSTSVTLHPAIVYYRDDDGNLNHISTVFVSDVLHHNSVMVNAIIGKIMSEITPRLPGVQYIHFWTDSPTSQYRNKTIFYMVSEFEERYGVRASWHYFESGHGKGPCDGIGGTTKRNADNAIKQGKAVIQDATDFFAWAKSTESQIDYIYITSDEFHENKVIIDRVNENIKPVKGTMALHSVIGLSVGQISIRNTTCACVQCFTDKGFSPVSSCGWVSRGLQKTDTAKVPQVEVREQEVRDEPSAELNAVNVVVQHPVIGEQQSPELNVDSFVIVNYDGRRYIGKIVDIDNDDDEIHVVFMENSGKVDGRFRWPRREDDLWLNKSDVLKVIPEPSATGKSRRVFEVPIEILELMK